MAVLFVGLVAFAVAGYAMGWLSFKQSPEQTTIEINTHQIEEAAHEAQQEGADLIQVAGKKLRESGAALDDNLDGAAKRDGDLP
jgi:hypothetical protein